MTRASTVPSPTPASNKPQRRRSRVNAAELQRHPLRRHPLFAAGMDEQQVFLAIFEKPEIAAGSRFSGGTSSLRGGSTPAGHRGRDIGLDTVEGVDRDSLALAQPVHQLAIVYSAATECRFRHVGLATEFRDLAQDLVVFHRIKDLGRLVGSR